MSLSDTAIRNAKPKEKPYKITDGKGLYLLVTKSGRYFRFDYRFGGKRLTLALGVYPDMTLKVAREKHGEARQQLANGIDPGQFKKSIKNMDKARAANSFEAVAREWFFKKSPVWAESHSLKIIARLEQDIFPWLGGKPINEVTAPDLLAALRRVESRGAVDTAHRAKQTCSQIFRYAIATGRAERDTAADLRGALQSINKQHFPTITEPPKIGALLRNLNEYSGSFVVKCALKLAPLTFVRPGELRHAEWNEIDMNLAEWRIPAAKMKMKTTHIIPLSRQALQILQDLRPLTGSGKYLFPSIRTTDRPMSENTVNGALRRLGYTKEELTGHGFRGMASTSLHEHGWPSDIIERQLAHGERNPVKAAYNHAEYLPERRRMMQAWADYLDGLATGGKIVSLKFDSIKK
ncbi:MAG: tyrosine-type recombinase/integrase [Proteobacteria bacterium]|nr:tyrosine-type recombinase/integrase [Pseudomonadota bacterium]MBU4294463.1 tyrosine-type recombinase/integrase [Pseudomonadota bacterium]MCG2749170.1 tyrosine-type recombinase/integrase [Desulfobulbaceae bacterium]